MVAAGIGQPTGNGPSLSSISVVTRTLVTATVASVGPYVFQTSAAGNRSRSCRAAPGRNVSPQNKNFRIPGNRPASNVFSSRHTCANDGVETQTVASDWFNAWKSALNCAISPRVTL